MVLVKTPSFQRTGGEASHSGMLDTPTARRGRLHGLPGQASRDDHNPCFLGSQGFDTTMGPCVVLSPQSSGTGRFFERVPNIFRGYWTCSGTDASSALTPFHRICTPMQTSRNEESRRITLMAVAPRSCAIRSANA